MTLRNPDFSLPAGIRTALWLIFAGYVVYVASMHIGGYERAARGERPWYTDFTHAYAGSLLVRYMPAENLYRDPVFVRAMQEAARVAYGPALSERHARSINFAPWMYPPPFILAIAPLAFMPYLLAWFVWIGVTAVPYLAAMRAILPGVSAWRGAWPFALAAPTTFSNLMYGQTGFLSAGLIGFGLTQLQRRPLLAGLFIGLASIKPHLGLLIPVALAAGGHWRAFGAATLTTLGLILASALVYGLEPWYATLGSIDFYVQGFELGGYGMLAMTSVLSTVRVPGGSVEAMWAAQHAATAAMAVLVAWVWWRGRTCAGSLGLQSAILCFAAPLAVPAVYVYDLALLVPGAAWLWCDFRARGAAGWEKGVLVVAMAAPMFVYEFAKVSGVQLGAVGVVALLVLAVRRFRGWKASDTAAAQAVGA